MINFDYYIKRDEKNRIREFTPQQIPTELPNVVYIEGPNSSGKSTLLHILSIAFNGLSGGYAIKPTLREKMENLVKSSHQRIKFDISITDKNGDIELVSKKKDLDSDEIEIRNREKKLVAPDDFIRKYRLIYDIPENPTERLKDLLHEIEDVQRTQGNRLRLLREYVDALVNDIKEGYNPKKIREKQDELKKMEDNIANEERAIKSLEELLKEFKIYTYAMGFMDSSEEHKKLKANLSMMAQYDREKRKKTRRVTKEYREKYNEFVKLIEKAQDLHKKVTPILKAIFKSEEKERLKIWQDLNIEDEIKNHKLKKNLHLESTHFVQKLKELQKNVISSNKDLQKANIYNELISLLENYKNIEMELPGVGLSIPKFIAILKKETTKYEDIRIKADHLSQAITYLNDLLTVRKTAMEIIDHTMAAIEAKSNDTDLVEYDESQDKYEKITLKMQAAQKMVEYYKAECAKLEIKESEIKLYCESVLTSKDFKKFRQYTPNDLKEKIASLQEEIYNKSNELDRHGQYIKLILKPELDTLEHKKPHPFTNYLDELKQISGMVIRMEQKLTLEFDEYIRELIQRNVNKKSIAGEKQKYYDLVFEFLAKKIGYILHINEMHELKKIDLIDGIIITTKGTEIRIRDMGTGQSQSAYLTALLSSTDNRKIIALFDEVAMMDNRSLQQVYIKLKELYAQGKLLIAIIVQKGEKLQISRIA